MNAESAPVASASFQSRVPDGLRALALLFVIAGHCLAWNRTSNHGLGNVLEVRPQLWWITWIVQIMPLFFLFAGSGLTRFSQDQSGKRYLMRGYMLLSPATILLTVAAGVGLLTLPMRSSSATNAVGLLLIQLTWFLAVYVLILAIAPFLSRFSSAPGIAMWSILVVGIDVLRVNVNSNLGWLNMVAVWSLFALVGMRLKDLQKVPALVALMGSVVCWIGAWAGIHFGPYSKALISVAGIPGLSNLAPPSVVLACSGLGQIFLVIAAWRGLEKIFSNKYVWAVVGGFGMRSMQVYLHQMIFIMLAVSPFVFIESHPDPLSLLWWLEHVAVFVITLASAWLTAPFFRRSADNFSRTILTRLVPQSLVCKLGDLPRGLARLILGFTGLLMLIQSSTGLNNMFTPHQVLGLAVPPVLPWALIMISIAIMATVAPSRGREG